MTLKDYLQKYIDSLPEGAGGMIVSDFILVMAEEGLSADEPSTMVRFVASDSPMYRLDGLFHEAARRMHTLVHEYEGHD